MDGGEQVEEVIPLLFRLTSLKNTKVAKFMGMERKWSSLVIAIQKTPSRLGSWNGDPILLRTYFFGWEAVMEKDRKYIYSNEEKVDNGKWM